MCEAFFMQNIECNEIPITFGTEGYHFKKISTINVTIQLFFYFCLTIIFSQTKTNYRKIRRNHQRELIKSYSATRQNHGY